MNRAPRAAVIALLLAAGLARAQNTQVIFEASSNSGLTWHASVEARPDSTVLVRLRVRLIDAPNPNSVRGLSAITLQPRLTTWNPAIDERLPLTTSDGSAVQEQPQTNLGRIFPFAAAGMGSSSTSGLLTSHVDAGNALRFAGANAVLPTTNNSWGVVLAQLPFSMGTGFRTDFDVVVFRYGVRLGGEDRVLVADVDRATILAGRSSWYMLNGSNLPAPVRDEDILPATIHVIPAPSTLAFILAALALTPSRRRSRL